MEWINAKENQPKDSSRILVYNGEIMIATFHTTLGFWQDKNKNPIEWVTHWMELPEPPT